MEILKPYYKRKNKYFFKKGKAKTTITHKATGEYVFDGDVIDNAILKLNDKTEFGLRVVKQ